MNRILIATDGSPSSREAVEFGIELAEAEEADVVFVHVLKPMDIYSTSGFGMVGAMPHEPTEDERNVLEEAEEVAESHGVRSTTKLVLGDATDEIVSYADDLDVDLIVIGSRGHGTLASALLGSVSRGVLSESKRPVAVVRGLATAEVAGTTTH